MASQPEVSCGACGMLGHTSMECRSGQEQVHAFQSHQQGSPYSGVYNENTRNHPNFSWKSNNVLNPPVQPQQPTYQKPYQPSGFQRPNFQQPQSYIPPSPPPNNDLAEVKAMLLQSITIQQQTQASQKTQEEKLNQLMLHQKAQDEKLNQLGLHQKAMDTQLAQMAISNSTRQQGSLPPQGQQPHETVNAITLRSGTNYTGPQMPQGNQVEGLSKTSDMETERFLAQNEADFSNMSKSDRFDPKIRSDINENSTRELLQSKSDRIISRPIGFDPTRPDLTPGARILTENAENIANTKPSALPKEPEKPIIIKLPFPNRQINQKMEHQFKKFMEVVKNLQVSVPFTELITQVPSYAKFLKDIITRKRSLNTSETVAFTEECSQILQGRSPPKLNDPGSFSITCSIGNLVIDKALCDLGASVSVMPYSVCKKLNMGDLKCTSMTLQMADRSIKYPRGILEDVPVKIGQFFIPVDFVVLDMAEDAQIPIILGRPFLHTAGAVIDVKNGNLTLEVAGEKITFNLSRTLKQPMLEESCCFIDVIDNAVEEVWHDSLMRDPLAALRYFDSCADEIDNVGAVEVNLNTTESVQENCKKASELSRTKKKEQVQLAKREWVEVKRKLPKERKQVRVPPLDNGRIINIAEKQVDDLRKELAAAETRLSELEKRIKAPDIEEFGIDRFGGVTPLPGIDRN